MRHFLLLGSLVLILNLQCIAGRKPPPEKLKEYKDFVDKVKAKRVSTQEDAESGGNLMRVDKKGGRVILVRNKQLLDVRVKAIVEKFKNETEASKSISLKDVTCTKSKSVNNDDEKYTVKSVSVELKCILPNSAEAVLKLFMFKDDGNVTGEDGNVYEVSSGGTKMNLEINNWPGKPEVIDVTFGMRCGLSVLKGAKPKKLSKMFGKRDPKKPANRRAPESFGVCPEARATFASNYKSDGTDIDMPEGYPKANEELPENEAEITLRFKGKAIVYDPVMEVGEDVEGTESTNNAVVTAPSAFMMLAIFAFLQSKLF